MKTPKKIILIADDDEAILESTQLLLEMNDYLVITSTGRDVLALAKKHHPAVILLDIWMGGIDGKQLCKKIKKTSALSSIPVIMVSASTSIASSITELGATDFIEKPFDIDTLMGKIENVT